MAHHSFLARTIMVGEKAGVNSALRVLRNVMSSEKQLKDIQLKMRYEKPTIKRRRKKYESALKLYNSEMQKKVDFIMKGQRKETPWS
jgi:ribosomal protein S21